MRNPLLEPLWFSLLLFLLQPMMEYDLSSILVSKKAYLKKLPQIPIGEKLLLIEKMRERDLTIGKSRPDLAEKIPHPPTHLYARKRNRGRSSKYD